MMTIFIAVMNHLAGGQGDKINLLLPNLNNGTAPEALHYKTGKDAGELFFRSMLGIVSEENGIKGGQAFYSYVERNYRG